MTKNVPLFIDLLATGYNRGLPNRDGSPGLWQPLFDGQTFCNHFVQFVCNGMGYSEMEGLLANDMIDFMANPANGWITQSEDIAQARANDGIVVVAGWKNPDGHGHVNILCPGLLEMSSSYGRKIPKCVNIGETVFFGKKISWAFSPNRQPTYFAFASSI